jgi:hypothetical protein
MHGDIRDWSTFHLVASRAGRLLRRPAHADLSPGKVHLGRRWLSNEKILIALPDGGTLTVQPKYRYLQPSLQRPRPRVHSRRGPQFGPSRHVQSLSSRRAAGELSGYRCGGQAGRMDTILHQKILTKPWPPPANERHAMSPRPVSSPAVRSANSTLYMAQILRVQVRLIPFLHPFHAPWP